MSNSRYINRIKGSILPVLVLVISFLVYGPIELFITNKGSEEIWFSLTDLALPMVGFTLVALLLIMGLLMILPEKGYRAAVAIITAIGVLFILQGMFLPNSYGLLNGEQIDWSQYGIRSVYNTVIWVALLAGALIWALKDWKSFRGIAVFASILVISIEILTLAISGFITNGKKQAVDTANVFLTTDREFDVSSSSNTIVYLLDAFDGELMMNLLDQNSDELHEVFADFTFYHNTSGGAAGTKYAIPFILTSTTNDTGHSYTEYLAERFQTSPLFKELRTGKYDTGLYTESAYVDLTQNVALDNLSTSGTLKPTSYLGLYGSMMKMTAFKYMPHVLKRFFWMYSFELSQWKGSGTDYSPYRINDQAFYEAMDKNGGLTISTDEPAFRFYHLKGAHGPYVLDENFESVPHEKGSKEKQGLGALRMTAKYLNELKRIGAYDNSTIFIIADHGDHLYGHEDYSQNPLFMVKVANDHKDFSISDTRLSFKDFDNMLVDALHGKPDIEAYECSGTRYMYNATENNNTYAIYEYASDGDAYDAESWAATGRTFEYQESNFDYTIGTRIYCGLKKNATAVKYFQKGFSEIESGHVWTKEQEVELKFDCGPIKDNLKFEFQYSAVNNNHQRCYIYVNGNLVESYLAEKNETKAIVIPKEYVSDGKIDIVFSLPDARSPLELGIGVDTRDLGLAFNNFLLEYTDDAFDSESQIELEAQGT